MASPETTPTVKTPLKQRFAADAQHVKNPADFVNYTYLSAHTFFGRTACFVMSIILGSTLPIIMLVIGSIYMNQCSAERNIPIYLVVGGAFGILRTFVAAVNKYRLGRMGVNPETRPSDPIYLTDAVLSLFLVIWFFIGSFWVFSHAFPSTDPKSAIYCHPVLYYFTFALLLTIYVTVILMCTFCCFCFCFLLCMAAISDNTVITVAPQAPVVNETV